MATEDMLKYQLDRLNVFIGKWDNQGIVHPGRFGSGGDCTGNTVYYWDTKTVWLHYTSQLLMPELGEYEVSGGVSYNDKEDTYIAFAHNNMRSLLTYNGYWEDSETIVFLSTFPNKDQARIVYTVSKNGSIHMKSQSLDTNGDYITYFETTMTTHDS